MREDHRAAHLLECGVSELEHIDDADESAVLHNRQVEVVAICESGDQQHSRSEWASTIARGLRRVPDLLCIFLSAS